MGDGREKKALGGVEYCASDGKVGQHRLQQERLVMMRLGKGGEEMDTVGEQQGGGARARRGWPA